ncbi:hypothetical protein J6590_047445 [Homalodisca vitripennis]|nr:hypothetical protein J6590_047445 [Homalodisca vitripennis]
MGRNGKANSENFADLKKTMESIENSLADVKARLVTLEQENNILKFKAGRLLAAWSRNGRITVRKCENAAATRVWCPRDVNRIMGDVSQDMDCTRTEK